MHREGSARQSTMIELYEQQINLCLTLLDDAKTQKATRDETLPAARKDPQVEAAAKESSLSREMASKAADLCLFAEKENMLIGPISAHHLSSLHDEYACS
jgi:hypothetical protein